MVWDARERATRSGLPFSLTPEDISIPKRCPVLGLRLRVNRGRAGPNSPSLDRLIPRRGYVRGNVVVVSHRANQIRRDASVSELSKVTRWYRRRLRRR